MCGKNGLDIIIICMADYRLVSLGLGTTVQAYLR